MLNPLHLASFDAALRAGSFAGAARALGYTASAVSQHVAALEHDIGAILFERAPRSVTPTAAAYALAAPARRVLGILEGVEAEFTGWVTGRSGHLRLGGFPTANQHLLPGAITRLRQEAPDATVNLEDGEPAELVQSLHEGRLDLAVVYDYEGVPLDAGRPSGTTGRIGVLDHGVLLRESLVVLARPGVLPDGVRLADLADRPWVATAETTFGWHLLRRACLEAGFTPQISLRSNDYAVIRRLVAAGLGIALVPALAASPDPDIAIVQPVDLTLKRHIRLIQPSSTDNPLLPRVIGAFARAAADLVLIPGIVVTARTSELAAKPKDSSA